MCKLDSGGKFLAILLRHKRRVARVMLKSTWPNLEHQVLKSMKRRKAQELSTAEREQIAQEFIYKINKASEDDEKAVKEGRPALNKLKMLKVRNPRDR